MVLADTSAWIDFLRGRRTRPATRFEHHLRSDDLATTDVVVMEVLAGARDQTHLRRLAAMVALATHLPTRQEDYPAAAAIWRTCRGDGRTPRTVVDCLIAAVAMREDVPVLHGDRDFDAMARSVPLRIDA